MVLGDAQMVPIPPGITTGVLLMRHCRHFTHYRSKLERAGCRRLITNVLTGKANAMQYFMQGKVKLSGDLNLAMKLMQMFKIR